MYLYVAILVDLVPKEIAEKWLKYLRNEFPAIIFKSSTQTQKQNLVRIPDYY
jgi:nuclear GTP-binding protein